jgi:hypothetical protein
MRFGFGQTTSLGCISLELFLDEKSLRHNQPGVSTAQTQGRRGRRKRGERKSLT